MAFSLRWSRRSQLDTIQILDSLASIDEEAAKTLRDRFIESADLLERLPYLGARYERSPRVREILCEQYRIFYQVVKARQEVVILRVWHSARDEPNLSDF